MAARLQQIEDRTKIVMPQQTETVGQRINYVRTQQGLSLERLAQQAGLSKSFLWEVEQDRSGISGNRLLQVTDALHASVEYLLRGGSHAATEEPRTIEIPTELSEVAQELGLTYQHTLILLQVDRTILAYRSGKRRRRRNKEDWRSLFQDLRGHI